MKDFIMCFGWLLFILIIFCTCAVTSIFTGHKEQMKKLELVEKGIIKYQIIEERKEK